jgi:hypothetical protein
VLTLAEPEGYVRTFVDEGLPMQELLVEAAARGIAPGYVARLLVVLEPEQPGPGAAFCGATGERKIMHQENLIRRFIQRRQP